MGTAPVGVAPFTDLQVLAGGVYEISMDLSIQFVVGNEPPAETQASVIFSLFINDSTEAIESIFEATSTIDSAVFIFLRSGNTIGKTIQLRLAENDRLSVRVTFAIGNVVYRLPSLVVTKIAN